MNMKVKKCLLVVVMVFGMIVSFGGNKVEASEKVDINSATIEQLQKLDGVGAPLAQKIIDARPYKTVDELKAKVVGIGPAKMKAIQDQGLAVAESFPEKVDINKASLYDLQFLAGVGAPLAQKIIDARPYKTVDELQVKVVGIGAAKMKAIKDQGLAMVNEEKMIKEWFPDSNLASGVAESMGKNVEDIVTNDELAEITQLYAGESNYRYEISSLEGIQHLVNLTDLGIYLTKDVTDISNIKALFKLSTLFLNGGKINEVSLENLQNLTKLTSLSMDLDSGVSNLNSLSNLIRLTKLSLYGNANIRIGDISAVAKLKELKALTIRSCGLENLDALKNIEGLEKIDFESNRLVNIDGLINSKNLTEVNLSKNELKNLDSLMNNKGVLFIYAANNNLTNIEIVRNFKELFFLTINRNEIEDIDPLRELSKLTILDFGNNHVASIEPLKNKQDMFGMDGPNQTITLAEQRIAFGEDLIVENIAKHWDGTLLAPYKWSAGGVYKDSKFIWANPINDGTMKYSFTINESLKSFSGEVIIPYKVIR